MVYRRFIWGALARFLVVIAFLAASTFCLAVKDWWWTSAILFVLCLGFLLFFFRFVTKTNKDLARFIDAINYKDFAVNFKNTMTGGAFDQLHESFHSTLDQFKQLKLEKESQYQYLLLLVKELNVGILAIDASGKIRLKNQQACQLLDLPNLGEWNRYASKIPAFYTAVNSHQGMSPLLLAWPEMSMDLSIRLTYVHLQEGVHRLVVFQAIDAELDEKEVHSWNQLIKVLTHEIMNAVSPIGSLADTLRTMDYSSNHNGQQDLKLGLESISRRSQNLMRFVEDYKKLSSLSQPFKEKINISDYLNNFLAAYSGLFQTEKITLTLLPIAADASLYADQAQLHQLLSNLMQNSLVALRGRSNKEIIISYHTRENRQVLQLRDNGKGVSSDKLGQIFVPFFSTKKDGSGIGLSLCKQIMQLHGGQIKLSSVEDLYCQVRLIFLVGDSMECLSKTFEN